jgi:hypothetical protein
MGSTKKLKKQLMLPVIASMAVGASLLLGSCVSHRIYNEEPHQYLQELTVPGAAELSCDFAIIEFDDHGTFWKVDQMMDAVRLIRHRNEKAERGVLVVVYVHGWKHNADPKRSEGNLAKFRGDVIRLAREQHEAGAPNPDRVIGVYLGWRGATTRVPVQKELTFWTRRLTAERVVSYNMRETLFRVMTVTKERPESKCFIVGHSMGGLIVGKTLGPSLTTLLLSNGQQGTQLPVDLVVLANPALDALASWQFIDFLKRSNASMELRSSSGDTSEAPGPIIASITSEADIATGSVYTFGRTLGTLFSTFRRDHDESRPSQRHLATHSEGHVDYLVSHRARVEQGEIVLERVPNAYNNTSFWVIQVTAEICRDHNDLRNPLFGRLVDKISRLNRLYDTDVQSWMLIDPPTLTE